RLDLRGDAVVSLRPESDRPLQLFALAWARLPRGADAREIVAEDVRRAASFGAMHHENVCRRQLDSGIGGRDPRIIPLRELAAENVGNQARRQFDRLRNTREIVRDRDDAAYHRDVHHGAALRTRELSVRHGSIAGTKVDGLLRELLDPPA